MVPLAEKLVKVFSRDVSLFLIQWWDEALSKSFTAEFGAFGDQVFASNGLAITCFNVEKGSAEIQNAICEKLAHEEGYYFKKSGEFRNQIAETRRTIEIMGKKPRLDAEALESLKFSFQKLYPTFRLAIKIPADWAGQLTLLAPGDAGEIISAALEDRKQSEGLFEEVDFLAQKLVKQNLRDLDKPQRLSKFLSHEDLKKLALDQEVNWFEVLSRENGFVYSVKGIFTERDFHSVFRKIGYAYQDESFAGDHVKGSTAFAGGVIRGKARLVFSLDQLVDFKQGEVLVTPMTGPDFVPVMRKSVAVVTDEGGITCHASIVSRELKIPCVVGTRHATRLFKNGDLIEIDTLTGVIRKLEG